MQIAKIDNGNITVGDYRDLFPETSFPASGPDAEWMSENGCMGVSLFKPYDSATQKLVPAAPYIEGDWVYTVAVASLTEDELAAIAEQRKSSNAARAKAALQDTDWCENASVRNTNVTPHLTNGADFDTYRLALRAIVINPPVDVEQWPVQPQGVWA